MNRIAGLGIEPHDAVSAHRGGPEFTVLVEIGPIRERVVRQAVFGEFFRLGVEQRDLAGPIFGHRSGRSPDWLKIKNPACAAVKREAEEDWGR